MAVAMTQSQVRSPYRIREKSLEKKNTVILDPNFMPAK
jgi:hypothetical protein